MLAELRNWEMELLRTAVRCVAQFSTRFAAEVWQVKPSVARQRLRRLERRGLLCGRTVLVSELPGVKALSTWRPGEEFPHAGRISYQARKRWHDRHLAVRRVFYATGKARSLFGRETIKAPKDMQATHDLGLSMVYLHFLGRYRLLTRTCWLNESEYSHHRGRCVKVEDAMLCRDGQVLLLVDFCGAYRPDRVEALLRHAKQHHVPIALY